MQVLERGFAPAVFNYTDVDPDTLNALVHGVRSAHLKPGQTEPAPDEWGAIAGQRMRTSSLSDLGMPFFGERMRRRWCRQAAK
jgi:hypothetical protein